MSLKVSKLLARKATARAGIWAVRMVLPTLPTWKNESGFVRLSTTRPANCGYYAHLAMAPSDNRPRARWRVPMFARNRVFQQRRGLR